MLRALLVTVVIVLSGCIAHTPGKQLGERPAAWDSGAELSTFEQGRSHAGGAQDRIYHNASTPIKVPASCIAYRAGKQYSEDTCTVIPSPRTVFDRTFGPWHLYATWKAGDNDADRKRGDSVVAFDAADKPVAFWNGRMEPGGSFATE